MDLIVADDTTLSLEKIIRDASANHEHGKIAKIVDQLCQEYAYVVNQPHARNGGLIGLAAAAIALGSVRCLSTSYEGLKS